MAFDDVYRDQVALLIRALPYVAAEDCLALKGGLPSICFVGRCRVYPLISI